MSPTDQWCHLAKPIWILIGLQKNFASEMRRVEFESTFFTENFFARAGFAGFYSLEISLKSQTISDNRITSCSSMIESCVMAVPKSHL